MIPGLAGPLLSHDAIEVMLRAGDCGNLSSPVPASAASELRRSQALLRHRVGPACATRVVFDLVGEPLAGALGFTAIPVASRSEDVEAILHAGGVPAAALIVTPWGLPASAVWRLAIRAGLTHGTRWTFCLSPPAIRLFDTSRAYARQYAEFDLDVALDDERAIGVMWSVLRAAAFVPAAGGSMLDRIVAMCEQHRADVRSSLRNGVHDALLQLIAAFRAVASRRHPDAQILGESLIVVYRVLFLLFAEARGLVPSWHPVYRDGYTIEALREQLRRPGNQAGVWEALQALARLAHRGCRAGTLRVPPFNGRLFSPSDAPLADTVPLDDHVVSAALQALTTRRGSRGREAISYADLGVEQLGAVYEHLLDFDVGRTKPGAAPTLVPTGRRKATGSFYTPRPLTEFLVRRTLGPIVQNAASERILGLRVLDPAMGSGAFLVAACRYLAAGYEQALVREGVLAAADIREEDRAAFRRAVAQRCLFGVDVNPTAVQLGRLSLWLATLAADKPLSFFDHHLRTGNSLVGASIEDIMRHPAPGAARTAVRALPLFEIDAWQSSLVSAVSSRQAIAGTPDDTIEQVRRKERALAQLQLRDGPLERWRLAADVWCAAWYGQGRHAAGRAVVRDLLDGIVRGAGSLPAHVAEDLTAPARAVATEQRFFHWAFEFPEVFYDEAGAPRPDAGFDAIVGNPPWEMLRDDDRQDRGTELQTFVRGSGLYPLQGHGHSNLYQLFVERVSSLVRPDGRVGLVLPSGFSTDRACGALRRFMVERTSIDTFTLLENRDAIFPIHRALKFLLLTYSAGGETRQLPCRSGVRSLDLLDRVPDCERDEEALPVSTALIRRLSPLGLTVPEIRSSIDVDIVSAVSARIPALEDPDGWGVRFGRELNATEDKPHFREDGRGLPVIEGKQLHPFAVDVGAARFTIDERTASRLLTSALTFRRRRLAYRDVAAATNRMTLIAALVPAGVVTTHTVFCLKDLLDDDSQDFLCGVFNSFVANYFIRRHVVTHVTTAIVARLPVPRPPAGGRVFRRVARLSRAIARHRRAADVARLHAAVAGLYGLSERQFAHVLSTFPLAPEAEREEARRMLVTGLGY